MKVGSLFSGIGGLDLGLERAGMEIVWQAENDPYCSKVLAKHWPHVPNLGDVTKIEWEEVERVDLVCGGFPCQPVSLAGEQRAQADERWLWPEFARCVRGVRPRLVLVENVPGLLVRGMGDVLSDLAACGYDAEWDCIPAATIGAPHLRYRVFVVAYSDASGWDGRPGIFRAGWRRQSSDSGVTISDPSVARLPLGGQANESESAGGAHAWTERRGRSWWATEPAVGRVAHGVPARVDRLRALGNAVVPQVAEWIGTRILDAFSEREEVSA